MGTFLPQIDGVIQTGRGVAASVLGHTFNVYRLGQGSSNAIVNGTPLITGFHSRLKRAKKMAIENQAFDLMVFEATCDNRQLQLQDVLVQTDGHGAGDTYVYAQARETHETLLVRAEFNISITRPMPPAGQSSQAGDSSFVYVSGDASSVTERDNEQVLTLSEGLFSFSTSGYGITQASVPAGLQPLNRVRDGSTLDVPTELPRVHYLVYMPMLPGIIINEDDILSFPQSAGTPDRYDIKMLFTSEYTGLSGWIMVVEKRGN